MTLYVCYDFLKHVTMTPRPGGHPCGNAYKALLDAGHTPEVEGVGGLMIPPLNRTAGRRRVQAVTGQTTVPVLVTDDGKPAAVLTRHDLLAFLSE